MSRQNFVATDFFLPASENEAQHFLNKLPCYLGHITLLKEHTLVHTTRFLYEDVERGESYYVDASLLWLNDQYTRVNLHVTYTNGHVFSSTTDIKNILGQFERAIHAARDGAPTDADSEQSKRQSRQRRPSLLMNALASIFLSKYHY